MAIGAVELLRSAEDIAAPRTRCARSVVGFLAARGIVAACHSLERWFSPTQVEPDPVEAGVSLQEGAYRLGLLYTSLLPERVRKELGAFYTPPALAERLLDLLEDQGVDWSRVRVLDPACGGGSFLLPVAARIARALRQQGASNAELGELLPQRLAGWEIDPFSADCTRAFLAAWAAQEGIPADFTGSVHTVDTLEHALEPEHQRSFTVVVGNPPYGRRHLTPVLREAYRRGLYGHANLYGLFVDAALRLAAPDGWIGLVTPTSFLTGDYFRRLRLLLEHEAPPVRIGFVERRKGVFPSVLQETCLTVFRVGAAPEEVRVESLRASVDGESVDRVPLTCLRLRARGGGPWLLPHDAASVPYAELAARHRHRLRDYGYRVATGPMVWNRHKGQLRERPGSQVYPIVWAEAVSPMSFTFDYARRTHPFVFVPPRQEAFLVYRERAVLVQRTTAKEQPRRIVAAALPQGFLDRWGGYVAENHINVVIPTRSRPALSLEALAALLNTEVVDRIFRCLNGSAAVSRFELEAVPLPPPERLVGLERVTGNSWAAEQVVRTAYGMGE